IKNKISEIDSESLLQERRIIDNRICEIKNENLVDDQDVVAL
ncbi:12357_t:CDS:1, partial [Dentiscutata heterogama]